MPLDDRCVPRAKKRQKSAALRRCQRSLPDWRQARLSEQCDRQKRATWVGRSTLSGAPATKQSQRRATTNIAMPSAVIMQKMSSMQHASMCAQRGGRTAPPLGPPSRRSAPAASTERPPLVLFGAVGQMCRMIFVAPGPPQAHTHAHTASLRRFYKAHPHNRASNERSTGGAPCEPTLEIVFFLDLVHNTPSQT